MTALDATVDALGVAVGLPNGCRADFAHFTTTNRDPDIVLPSADRVSMSGAFTSAAVDRTDTLCVHAGVVAGDNGAIVFPASSGSGKSTLVAALVKAGLGYLSDEVAAFDENLQVLPFPRSISVDASSLDVLGLPATGAEGSETLLDAADLGVVAHGPQRVLAVALIDRRSCEPARAVVTPQSASDGMSALVSSSFNHFKTPRRALHAFARLSSTVQVIRVRYEAAPDLAPVLTQWLARQV